MAAPFDLRKSRSILIEKLNEREPGDLRKLFSAATEWLQDRIRDAELDLMRHRTFRADDGTDATRLTRQAETTLNTLRRQHKFAIAVLQTQEWFQAEPLMDEMLWEWFGKATEKASTEGA
jgi:hypothetical protein